MKSAEKLATLTSLGVYSDAFQASSICELPSHLMERFVAHRGSHNNVPNNSLRRVPENSLHSLRQAFDCGVKFVECDIHMTADEQIIVFHDETLRKLARYNPSMATTLSSETFDSILDIPVQQLSYADIISQVDIGAYSAAFDPLLFRGTHIPLLEDFLNELKGHPERTLILELKTGNMPMLPKLKTLIEQHCQTDDLFLCQFIFISFDYEIIKASKVAFPANKHLLITIETPHLREAYPHPEDSGRYIGLYHRIKHQEDLLRIIEMSKNASLDGLCMEYSAKQIDAGFIEQLRDNGLTSMVWIYPKDDHVDMALHLLDADVDLISTNQPKSIFDALSGKK